MPEGHSFPALCFTGACMPGLPGPRGKETEAGGEGDPREQCREQHLDLKLQVIPQWAASWTALDGILAATCSWSRDAQANPGPEKSPWPACSPLATNHSVFLPSSWSLEETTCVSLGPTPSQLPALFQAYSLVDREVGYCQGSAFIVGLLLMQVGVIQPQDSSHQPQALPRAINRVVNTLQKFGLVLLV